MGKTASSRSGYRWVQGIKEMVLVIFKSVSSAFLSLLSEICSAGWILTSPCSSGLFKIFTNVLYVVHLMPSLFGVWGWLKMFFPFPFERAAGDGKAWPLYFCAETVGQYLLAKVGVTFCLGVAMPALRRYCLLLSSCFFRLMLYEVGEGMMPVSVPQPKAHWGLRVLQWRLASHFLSLEGSQST